LGIILVEICEGSLINTIDVEAELESRYPEVAVISNECLMACGCEGSLINTIDVEAELESRYPEVAVISNECLMACGLCTYSPFAMVNGKRIFAKTPEACLEKIKAAIETELKNLS